MAQMDQLDTGPFLQRREMAYETMPCECLALLWTVSLLQAYREEYRFTIGIDDDSLGWILSLTESSEKLRHVRLKFS